MKQFLKFLFRSILFIFILVNIVVAFNAYKFTHFYDPTEVVKKPNSEKSTWDKTKEILFGINAVKKINQAADTNFQTIYLTTKDGIKLSAWYIPVENAKGTVALFHGHGGNKTDVLPEAAEFRKLGYNTLLTDFRAHGNSGGNTCTIGYKEAEDVKLLYDYLKNKGEKNIVLWGISLGAATITKAINDYDLLPQKIILEMPFGDLLSAAEGRIKMMHLPAEPLSALLTFWGGAEHGFWAFGMKPYEYAKKISCPVLLQWGRHDPRVTETEIQKIYANIPTQKKLVVYENSGHQSLCINEHLKWVNEITSFLQ
ncbi:MAG: alpha/beta hydrolase [Bacteroidetes bacterium]|nr:alpha/beta hydrolase [Bacteroidota bacterium]MBS1757801.1 alpha/beta hydrolase [Bacteroidota bacterium]